MVKTVTIRGRECIPLNKRSAIAMSGGYVYESENDIPRLAYDAPPSMQKVPSDIKDLTGTKRGRVTIVGYLGESETLSRRKWIGKCVCGKYVIRMGRSWKRGLNKNEGDRGCIHCIEMDYLREKASQLSLGAEPLSYGQWNKRRIHGNQKSKSC